MDGIRILHGLNEDHTNAEVKRTVLREAVERFNNELMGEDERLQLLDRIKRLRKQLGL